jgi:polar amino acid transport system substrate-binding protein
LVADAFVEHARQIHARILLHTAGVRRRAGFALAVAMFAAACTGPPPPDGGTLARVRARGEITWGADLQGGEPYTYEDPADPSHIIGFEVDIMDGVARRLGVRARMVQYAWSNLVPSLERGDFDVATNGLEATSERQQRILLSRPYFIYAEVLAVRTDSTVRSLFDLSGKRVATLNQTYAQQLLGMIPSIEPVVYEGTEEQYLDLAQGRVDGVLIDNIIAVRYGCNDKHPELRCLSPEVARGTYVIGMRRADTELARAIDGALDGMRADGELERILRSYHIWDERQVEAPTPTWQVPALPGRAATPSVAEGRATATGGREFDAEMLDQFLVATKVTFTLTLDSFVIAILLGMVLAVVRLYGDPVSRTLARVYIELFRGTPVLLQLFILYYGLAPYWKLGAVEAAVLGLGLNYAAYEAEVYRGALLALPRGQAEAAAALGLSKLQTLHFVLLPQAFRIALPAMTNDLVSLLKDSSLVSAITVIELTKRMTIAAVDMRGWLVPGIACAALYLVLSVPLSELARRLERSLARDQRPQAL